jgi:hypothetical protein
MKYGDAPAFRQALEHRLKSRSVGDGAGLARDRKRVAFDRLLARLLSVAPGQWLLKGGFALDLRLLDRARATKDIDIDWQDDRNALLDALIDASDHDAGDFFILTIERIGIPEDRLGESHRFRVTASLAGRHFETFLLDVGFRAEESVATEIITTTNLLTFADIPPVEIRALQLECQVAEKVHAYTRIYAGAQPSSRAKDLVDIALIAELEQLDGQQLHNAITTTFCRRDTHTAPSTLPFPPSEWNLPYRQLAEMVGIPTQLTTGHHRAAALLDPILGGQATGTWDPQHQRWTDSSTSYRSN